MLELYQKIMWIKNNRKSNRKSNRILNRKNSRKNSRKNRTKNWKACYQKNRRQRKNKYVKEENKP